MERDVLINLIFWTHHDEDDSGSIIYFKYPILELRFAFTENTEIIKNTLKFILKNRHVYFQFSNKTERAHWLFS